MGNKTSKYEDPEYVAHKVEHVAYRYVDEDYLLGLSADSTHFSQEHHQKNDNADNISFYIKRRIIDFHVAIICH